MLHNENYTVHLNEPFKFKKNKIEELIESFDGYKSDGNPLVTSVVVKI